MNEISGQSPSKQLENITDFIGQNKDEKYGDALAYKEIKQVRLDRFQVGNLVYLKIAHFISNNQEKLNVEELSQLHRVLSKEISAIRAETGGIKGFFRYLFHQSDKSARLQQKDYLEGLKAIVENIMNVQRKEMSVNVEKAEVSKNEKIEEKRLLDSDVVKTEQEIERLQNAIVWVLKIKLDGLKGECLNRAGAIKAFIGQHAEYFQDKEGELFLLELQKYQEDLSSIPYYAKLDVQDGDIHTYEEVRAKVKEIMEYSTSLHKNAKLFLPKFPKGTEEKKNFVKLLTAFAERLNQQQLIFKNPSSDVYINGMQRDLGAFLKLLMT